MRHNNGISEFEKEKINSGAKERNKETKKHKMKEKRGMKQQ